MILGTKALRSCSSERSRRTGYRNAEAPDLAGRNVVALADTPKGQDGPRSKSLTLDQARAVLRSARSSRIFADVVLSLLTGLRTEESRA